MADRDRIAKKARGLGPTQILVLRLLASAGPCSAPQLSNHWPSLSDSAASAAVNRLASRGLVDAAGFRDNARTYRLTETGRAVEQHLNDGEEATDA